MSQKYRTDHDRIFKELLSVFLTERTNKALDGILKSPDWRFKDKRTELAEALFNFTKLEDLTNWLESNKVS